MDKKVVTSNDLWKENICNDYGRKISNTFVISKSSRKCSAPSDVKSDSFNKSSSSNVPVIKIMLKCVLELADKDLKPQIKAESLSIINRILGTVSSVLQRQIMRNILLRMGLEDILPSLSIYKSSRLNDELKIFEKGQHLEESIQLSKSGKHPLNIFSEAYMKLAKNKNYLTIFMEFIEKIASSSEINKNDILKLYSCLPKTFEKEDLLKEKECFAKSVLNNNTIHILKNEIIEKSPKKFKESDKNLLQNLNRCRAISISTELPNTYKEREFLFKRKTVNVEVQTEDYQESFSNHLAKVNKIENLKITENNSKPPEAPHLPKCFEKTHSAKKVESLNVPEESVVINSKDKKLLPPPPPPPPVSLKGNKQCSQLPCGNIIKNSNLLDGENTFCLKMLPKYSKLKATNIVSWTPIKINSLENAKTIWNHFVEQEFTEPERNKLELVFEKPQKTPRRLILTTFGKRSKDNVPLNKYNNKLLNKGISEKRALNLGIVLSRFKLKGVNLVETLDSEKCLAFDIDLISNLLLQYPTNEEKKYFESINELSTLNETEAFIWAISRKPNLKIKLELMVFKANFDMDSKNFIKTVEQCLNICEKLYQNPNIDKFFYKCLQIGNFLNQDSYNADAHGFTITSFINFLTLKGTVTNKNASIRIVDLLVEFEFFNIKEIYKLCDELESIKSFDLNDFEIMSNKICQQVKSIKDKVETTASFVITEEISDVFKNSISTCDKLKQLIADIKSLEENLQKYYCADKLKLEEIISIFSKAFDLLKKTNLVYERSKIQSEQASKTFQSFGKPLGKLKKRIVKSDPRKNFDITTLVDLINQNR